MTEKTFDKADLLKYFDEGGHTAIVGRLTVVFPAKDLYNDSTTERYPIAAATQALHCEKYGFAVVRQFVQCEGLHNLPKDHPLRTEKPLHFRHTGGDSSAQLTRWAAELADEWRAWVKDAAPQYAIDMTQLAAAQPEVQEPTPENDDDHTPTGATVDNPFEGDDE